ncbi:peptide/nickel transport system permease protein [Faunimonas pinastri]|uniref:Peptide/nickel transport system permease protein n=1 Tax=Faunimonas pinastri TaxID=1855383 RepID=A0A1H9DX38_9HYPH|nr:ABC transporter permease [Faunimonas pinastri]SEQ17996.1 peptide/nickel transport system permease protein [Faunimonas pinastri]
MGRFIRALEPAGILGLALVTLLILVGLFGPSLLTVDPLATNPAATLQAPSAAHLFGTDNLGRDTLAGIVAGARTALLVGFLSVAFALVLGLAIGATAGYYGGALDAVLDRVIQLFIIIPRLFLAMTLVSLFGTSIWTVIVTIGLVSWPQVARLTRAEFKTLRRAEYVEATIAAGATTLRVILRHLIPNTLPTLIANASLLMSAAILLEAGLAFFGLSDPSRVSWGSMLSNAQQFLLVSFWMPLFPGLALSITGLGLNLLGDSLTRALSPKLRRSVRRSTKHLKPALRRP